MRTISQVRAHKSLYEWSKEIAKQKETSIVEATRIIAEEHREFHFKIKEIRNKELEQAANNYLQNAPPQKRTRMFRI